MNVHEVEDYQIYATSALRESKNHKDVIFEIKKTNRVIFFIMFFFIKI